MSRGLLRYARLTRSQLIFFALASAAINGVVTATVGAWLARTYAIHQSRRQSIESIAHLVYERRTRAGMIASAIRRDADVEEVRHRKQAYDEAYVDWNKNVMLNLFAIREVAGDFKFSSLELVFENRLVDAMADVDRCITKAYDKRIANQDGKAVLEQCKMPVLHQFVLDCGATFSNELYKMTQLTFIPLSGQFSETKRLAEERIDKACSKPAAAKAAEPPVASPPAAPVTQPGTSSEAKPAAGDGAPSPTSQSPVATLPAAPVAPQETPKVSGGQ
ncbi:MAG: hypothetical protein WC807_13230 [Hyphomicrobium sp.]|jgi:hypothetical protein